MARDMDLVRDIMLKIDRGEREFDTASAETASILDEDTEGKLSEEDADKLSLHLDMLEDAGLIKIHVKYADGLIHVKDLTWSGYDFLETVRDPEVWKKTKEGASKIGGWTFGLIKDMGTAYLKHAAKERLGLDL